MTSNCLVSLLSSSTARSFIDVYLSSQTPIVGETLSSCVHPDDLVDLFDSTCTATLDSIAPLTSQRSSVVKKVQPWINGPTCAVKQEYRCAERRWRKDKLHISCEIFRECLKQYQNAVREAQFKFMSDLIAQNSQRP